MAPAWPTLAVAASWGTRTLVAGVINGSLYAAAAWLATATLLKRASGRALAVLWLVVLVKFVLVGAALVRLPELAAPLARATVAGGASVRAVLATLYAAVVAGALARTLWRHRRIHRLALALEPADGALQHALGAAARTMGLGRLPALRVTGATLSPFTVGAWRPVLVLPRWLCVPGPRLDAALLHELAHLERGDAWLLWIERAIAALFFFWPPVRWARRRLDEARELACDERAIARGGLDAVAYGRLLVDVVAQAGTPPATALAMACAPSRLGRRIDRLLQSPPGTPWRWRGALALLLALSLLALRPAARAVALPSVASPPSRPAPALDEPAMSQPEMDEPETNEPAMSQPE